MNPIENLKDLIIYQSQNNDNVSVEVLYDNEDFWLTQKSMSKLFEVEVNTINYHLKEIFKSSELTEESVIRKIRITANDGKNYNTNFYSLDAIIAVGYRVNSKQATDFRIWATNTLKEYIKKGFVLNDELLKNGPKFGKDYFKELLERIRSIRTSERRIWQQITDIFAECSIDYDKNSESKFLNSLDFYSTNIQEKDEISICVREKDKSDDFIKTKMYYEISLKKDNINRSNNIFYYIDNKKLSIIPGASEYVNMALITIAFYELEEMIKDISLERNRLFSTNQGKFKKHIANFVY